MKKLSVSLVAILCVMALFLQGCSMQDLSALLGGSVLSQELSAEDLYYMYAESVVEVTAKADGMMSTGTGFFCDAKGSVITNYHVIETCTDVQITLITGESYPVKEVLGYSVEKDIAILSTDCIGMTALPMRTTQVLTGEKVYAIGSSMGLTSTLSEGIVSCAQRLFYEDIYIQTTAPISPGNSGGPLFDRFGNVIGINSMQMVEGQNLNFALPIAEALALDIGNPVTLEELFTRKSSGNGVVVSSLNNWSVQYIGEDESKTGEDQFMLRFQLRDRNGKIVRTDGAVSMKIVNELGVTVYEKTLSFSRANAIEVHNRQGDFEFMSVSFNMSDVTPDDAYGGMLYFTVRGTGYVFEECAVYIDYLPVNP